MSSNSVATPIYGLYSTRQAAKFLCKSESYLAKARMTGEGPVYVKMGGNVRYDLKDLVAWVERNKRHSTSETIPPLVNAGS